MDEENKVFLNWRLDIILSTIFTAVLSPEENVSINA